MSNFNNSNVKASEFLTILLAEMKKNDVCNFDVTKFIDVVMHLKKTPDFEMILNGFSSRFEECQSQMMEMCATLKEASYIEGETLYELHFLNRNFDERQENLPKNIDRDLLNRFFHFMQALQEKISQNRIPASQLFQVIQYCQKRGNVLEKDIKKLNQEILRYLSAFSGLGFLTMPSVYSVSISDSQLEAVLKNNSREKYSHFINQVDKFIEYYQHPEKLESIPIDAEQIQPNLESTLNLLEEKEFSSKLPNIEDFSNKKSFPNTRNKEENSLLSGSYSQVSWPVSKLAENEPIQFEPITSRHIEPNSHFKSVRGVLLSFLSSLQIKGSQKFDSDAFESAMNEIMKSQFYYEFPSDFPKFAKQYIGVPLERNNPYQILDHLARKSQVKREGKFCFKLKFPKEMIDKCLNKLTKEDLEKIEYLTEQYLISFHKMSR